MSDFSGHASRERRELLEAGVVGRELPESEAQRRQVCVGVRQPLLVLRPQTRCPERRLLPGTRGVVGRLGGLVAGALDG